MLLIQKLECATEKPAMDGVDGNPRSSRMVSVYMRKFAHWVSHNAGDKRNTETKKLYLKFTNISELK